MSNAIPGKDDESKRPLRDVVLSLALVFGGGVAGCHAHPRPPSHDRSFPQEPPLTKEALWEKQNAIAARIYDARRPSYRALHPNRWICVTSTGREFIDVHLADLHARLSTEWREDEGGLVGPTSEGRASE